jgi:hypothetical protein
MTTQDENRDIVQTSAFDPFPQPQTIPSGWDTSGLLSAPQPVTGTETVDAADSDAQEDK